MIQAIRATAAVAAIGALCAASPARSQEPVRLSDGVGGATCRLVSLTGRIPWQHERGDWHDASGTAQGNRPFGEIRLTAPTPAFVELDVLALVKDSASRQQRAVGLLLRSLAGSPVAFHSRESTRGELRPMLIIKRRNGPPDRIRPEADTALDCTSESSLGATPLLSIHSGSSVALSFALPAGMRDADIESATLQLAPKDVYGAAAAIGAFRLALPAGISGAPVTGIASRYPKDAGLEGDPAVVLAEGFGSPLWRLQWGKRIVPSIRLAIDTQNPAWLMWGARWFRGQYATVDADPELRFEPLAGKALRVKIGRGERLGLDLRYYFLDHLGSEPDAIYMRYYLRLSDNWEPADSGKLPGLAGTYGRAGWGDRPTDGVNGWSMRGSFSLPGPKGDQFEGRTAVGSFGTYGNAEFRDGAAISWPGAGLGLLSRNRWYCIEQYVKLNDPGVANGEFRAWIDGRPALENKKMHYRDTDKLKIETAWFDVYHGGTTVAPKDLHLYIDNVVIARSYIGPMAR